MSGIGRWKSWIYVGNCAGGPVWPYIFGRQWRAVGICELSFDTSFCNADGRSQIPLLANYRTLWQPTGIERTVFSMNNGWLPFWALPTLGLEPLSERM